jgi:predicted amidohydrolase
MYSLCMALVLAAAPSSDWRAWSPRAEIAPVHRIDSTGALVIGGGGKASVFGGLERVYGGIRPGAWYRLTASYRAAGLTYESRQVVARLDWQSAAGRRAGQPDYAWRVTASGARRDIVLEAPAPEGSSAVKVQLLLVNAPSGKVSWSDVRLLPVDAPKARPVRVATVRLRPQGPDPIARFASLVESRIAPGSADIILLPEGAPLVGTGKSYVDVAESVPGPLTARLGELARSRQAWLVAGVLEREGPAVYNTAVLLDRNGRLAGRYRKVYLPREEYEGGLTPGGDYPVFDTDFGRVGMIICWDVHYADPARALALRGAELVLMPIWGGNEVLARARAIENHLFIASSGYGFPSLIYDPDGETLARSEEDGTVVSATIDLNRRYVDKWLGEMRGRFFKELRGDTPVEPAARK